MIHLFIYLFCLRPKIGLKITQRKAGLTGSFHLLPHLLNAIFPPHIQKVVMNLFAFVHRFAGFSDRSENPVLIQVQKRVS